MRQVPLRGGARFAVVDDIDFDAVMAFTWAPRKGRGNCFYAHGTTQANAKGLHRFIADRAGITGRIIDHEDRDGLNNVRSNLRGCTYAQNAWNSVRSTGASGFPGVCKNRNNWAVRFDHLGQRVYLGTYRDIELAKSIAAMAHSVLRGEFLPSEVADQMGCDITVRNAVSAELAAARARVLELEGGRRMAA